ncbi:Gfo/Idh/MocA family protein [Plebeiibacterium sediminum]|uniref:Gfo/Idh/MocA family oxidoreductase n=1 Tax=Plebeiibacterium sediminum TaxID=2992112 RepID=A0AAE3SE87_9BACT|nr:Gfo/Idh/MocA family oxidoreductase [Plebeiobacterium sediminum]MCW3786238.1 Gfo/Idh/MocA family oxidoreductase [Plebeiobacterium sediminum]
MDQPKLKIGIIGLGRMGLMHAAIFNSLPDSEVVAVVDPAMFPAKPLNMLNPRINVYKSIDKMLKKETIDGVLIGSPVGYHIENAMECIKHNIPFLMEKPLAVKAGDAEKLLQELEKRQIPNMIGYMARNIDSFKKGKKIIEAKALGNIINVKGSVYVSQLFKKGKGWRYDPKISGGGVLESQGSHLLDLLYWYFGPVERVNADVLSVYSPGIEDFAHVNLNFKSGLKGWMDASWSVRFKRKMELRLEILGENGNLIITDDTVDLFLDEAVGDYNSGKIFYSANDLFTGVCIDINGAKFTNQDIEFINAIRENRQSSPSILDGFHIQKVVDACYESANDQGKPVLIS